MNVHGLIEKLDFEIINEGSNIDEEVTSVECCDLLSVAMGNLPSGCAWVTVMSNINTLAVASLCDAACIILAEDTQVDDLLLSKAAQQGITVFATEMPIFDAALIVYKEIHS